MLPKMRALRALLPFAAFLSLISAPALADGNVAELKAAYKRPLDIPFPKDAPYSPQIATLGKMLFFDPRVSGAQNLSCASCHNPSFGYEVPVPGAIGAANIPLPRKAPTVLNAAYTPIFFWDGRAPTLESQAAGPIGAPGEMNGNFDDILKRIHAIPEYDGWFKRLFPTEGATKDSVLRSIATYERTVVTGWAPFDRWIDGDENAISDQAKRGFVLFNGTAGCAGCHTGWNFSDNQFHNVGIGDTDIGRGKYEPNNLEAQGAFKTPGLRNLIYRAPFGHAGQFPDLRAIIKFYQSGGVNSPSKSLLIQPFSLNTGETEDLIAFLKSLTAEKVETPLPNLPN
jgi:cytochrome c peroxidase